LPYTTSALLRSVSIALRTSSRCPRLAPTRRAVRCPRCSSADVSLVSEFGSTACKAMYRCEACLEPFDHVKEI
jgi:ring-1,2-phenylacetyl-CoA epoxidase subunit PaaD